MKVVSLLLRGLEFFFTLLIIALVGNIIADAKSGNPSIINYCIFIAVFSMLSLVYLILGTVNESLSGNPVFMVGVDAINTLLFFCGGAALAAQLDVHSCGNKGYTDSNPITNGSDSPKKRCHEAQAACAFIWFAFACYAASTALSLLAMKGTSVPRPSIIRRGGPAMSQV